MQSAMIDEQLMGALYGPALDGDWRLALDRLRILLRSSDTALTVMEDGLSLLTLETTGRVLTPERRNSYVQFYGHLDPKLRILAGRGPGYLFNDARHFDADFVARDIFYQEYSRPIGSRHTLDMLIEREGKREVFLAAVRSPKEGPYDVQAETFFQRASRHFVRAFALKEKLDLAHRAGAALDRLSFGILVLGADLRIALANAVARRLTSDGELQIRNLRLFATSGAIGQQLDAMLQKATQGIAPASALRVPRSSGGDLQVWCASLPASSPLAHGERPGVLVVLRDLRSRPRLACEDLRALYGLTAAEAELALALAAGETLQSSAARRGVKYATVRSQLVAVLGKMGLNRQADLTRTIASLAMPVRGK